MMALDHCGPDKEFATDSCSTGCGGVSLSEYFYAEFPAFIQDLELHINALEMLSIVIALKIGGISSRVSGYWLIVITFLLV